MKPIACLSSSVLKTRSRPLQKRRVSGSDRLLPQRQIRIIEAYSMRMSRSRYLENLSTHIGDPLYACVLLRDDTADGYNVGYFSKVANPISSRF